MIRCVILVVVCAMVALRRRFPPGDLEQVPAEISVAGKHLCEPEGEASAVMTHPVRENCLNGTDYGGRATGPPNDKTTPPARTAEIGASAIQSLLRHGALSL